jgi:hypothetical protein
MYWQESPRFWRRLHRRVRRARETADSLTNLVSGSAALVMIGSFILIDKIKCLFKPTEYIPPSWYKKSDQSTGR